jgi:NAD(P)-dependent dehydrogenase (short-subunit alcohol dehydrogenase family)
MREFADKVAVITGAASGIGRGLVGQCAREGMSIVLADIDQAQLAILGRELDQQGVSNLQVPTDVADAAAVERLAQASYDRFGRVDLLFNNAGVMLTGYSWEQSVEDWQWLLNINIMGIVHGIRSFVPRLLAQEGEAHIVNTASVAALLSAPLMGPYSVSKSAVKALTETLSFELQDLAPLIKVSLLCPGQVATAIAESDKDRGSRASDVVPAEAALREFLTSGIASGMSPDRLAEITFDAIRKEQFWIFPHPGFKPAYSFRVEDTLAENNPRYVVLELEGDGSG